MKGMQRSVIGVAAALLLSVTPLFASFVAAATEQPRRGGTLVVAIGADPATLNVAVNSALETTVVGPQMLSVLARLDADGRPVPELADSWTASSDGLTYVFRLHPGIKWSDGQAFTSDDVKYSLLQVNRKYNAVATGALAVVDTIDTPDPLTVVFHLKFPYPPFLTGSIAAPNTAVIVPKHLYEGTDATKNDYNFKPVGTGPFIFKEWVRGDHITLERNPNYFKAGQPYLDKLVYKIIPDPAARIDALIKGEVDYIPYFALATTSVADLQKQKGITVVVDRKRPTYGIVTALFNLRNPTLKVKEVRQAIAYAIDRKIIVDKALDGLGDVASGPISSQQKEFYNPSIKRYASDITKANQLLDQSGFHKKSDGSRFTLRFSYQQGGEAGALEAAANIIREQLKAVGIALDLQSLDGAAYNNAAFVKWDFDITAVSYGSGPDPAIGTSRLYVSTNIKPLTLANNMNYINPQVDALFDQGSKELDPAKRVQIYNQVQSIIVEDLPALWLWEKVAPIAMRDTVRGFPSGPTHWESYDAVWVATGPPQGGGGSGTSPDTGTSAPVIVFGVAVLVVLILGAAWIVRRRRA